MPATNWPAAGTIVAYSIDVGVTWVAVGQVVNVSHGGGGEVGERDGTVLASPNKVPRPTIPDFGEFSFELNYDPTDTAHIQLKTWSKTPAAIDPEWKITWAVTGTKTTTFSGFVKNFDGPNAGGVDETLMASLTVRVSSPPVDA